MKEEKKEETKEVKEEVKPVEEKEVVTEEVKEEEKKEEVKEEVEEKKDEVTDLLKRVEVLETKEQPIIKLEGNEELKKVYALLDKVVSALEKLDSEVKTLSKVELKTTKSDSVSVEKKLGVINNEDEPEEIKEAKERYLEIKKIRETNLEEYQTNKSLQNEAISLLDQIRSYERKKSLS